jgi:hypothetical protein
VGALAGEFEGSGFADTAPRAADKGALSGQTHARSSPLPQGPEFAVGRKPWQVTTIVLKLEELSR